MSRIESLLGDDAALLTHQCRTIPRDSLHLPGPDFVDRVVAGTDRPPRVLGGLQWLFETGRLARTGYVSILPVDQGIEHSGRRVVRAEPRILRSREHREAGDRGRLQRGRVDARRARIRARAATRTRFRSSSS